MQINIYHDAECLKNLIGDIFQKPGIIIQPHNATGVIHTQKDTPPLGICKTANPLQILIPPAFLPLYILALRHALLCL